MTRVNWFPRMPAGCLTGMTIATDDMDADIMRLNQNGIETAPIDSTPWGKFAAIKDPDGNIWNLHQA